MSWNTYWYLKQLECQFIPGPRDGGTELSITSSLVRGQLRQALTTVDPSSAITQQPLCKCLVAYSRNSCCLCPVVQGGKHCMRARSRRKILVTWSSTSWRRFSGTTWREMFPNCDPKAHNCPKRHKNDNMSHCHSAGWHLTVTTPYPVNTTELWVTGSSRRREWQDKLHWLRVWEQIKFNNSLLSYCSEICTVVCCCRQISNFSYCFMWVWNLVCHITPRPVFEKLMLRENGESSIMRSVVLCSATENCLVDHGGFRGINYIYIYIYIYIYTVFWWSNLKERGNLVDLSISGG